LTNLDKKIRMFSSGQLVFALCFVVAFSTIIVLMYRKDAKGHKVHYSGAYKILIGFILAIIALFLIKVFVH